MAGATTQVDLTKVLLGISEAMGTIAQGQAAILELLNTKTVATTTTKAKASEKKSEPKAEEVFLVTAEQVLEIAASDWQLFSRFGVLRNSDGTIIYTKNSKGMTVCSQDPNSQFNGNDRNWCFQFSKRVQGGNKLSEAQVPQARRLVTKAINLGLVKGEAFGVSTKKPVGRPKGSKNK